MDFGFLILSTLCFLGGFCYSVAVLRSGRHRISWVHLAVMAGGFAFQSGFLYVLGQERGRCPITNLFDVLVFVSWSMVLFYFLLGPPFRVSLLGMFTAPLAFLFQTVALLLPASMKAGSAPPAEVDPWLETHAAVSLVAYGAFALASVAGVMFLVQDRQLKRHHLETLFYNLPPINLLGKSIFRLLAIGFALLTLGIASAFAMKQQPSAVHLGMTLTVWLVYGVIVSLQMFRGSNSKRLALNAIWAFMVPLITLWILRH
jgi:ABC-type uncharacterized transport system permease subunit